MDIHEIENLIEDANLELDDDLGDAMAASGMLYDLMNI